MNRLAALAAFAISATAFAQAVPDTRVAEASRLLRDGNDEEQNRAVRLLKDMGPQALRAMPAMIEALKDHPPARRIEIAKLLASHGLTAQEAIPALVAVVCEPRVDGNLFQEAVKAVAALGDPGNPEVVRRCMSFESQGRGGRYVSGAAPTYLAQHLAATLPVVVDFLSDANAATRQRAAISLALLVARPDNAKPSPIAGLPAATREHAARALQVAIDDYDDQRTRSWAAAALLDVEPTSIAKVVPILLAGVRSQHSGGSELRSLVRSGTTGARIVADYLDEPNPQIRQSVITCLSMFGDDALPALAAALRDPNPRVREGVVRTLNSVNRADKLPCHLIARLTDPDASVRLAAAVALARDPKRAEATVPVLTRFIFDANAQRRWEALSCLRGLGPVARPAIPELLRRVRSGDADTRLLAAETLAAADGSTWRSFVPVFIGIVKMDDGGMRIRAINRLRDVGPDARAALPALRNCFTDTDPMIRVQAVEAAYRIEPTTADEVVACLITVLRETPAGGRGYYRQLRATSRALDKMGPVATAAAPALIDAAKADPDAGFAPEMAAVAIRLDPEHAAAAYDMFRTNLNPGYADPDDLWLSRIPQLNKLALPLLPELIVALSSKQMVQVEAAFDTLVVLGPDAREAIPSLQALIKAKKHEARANQVLRAIEKK